MTQLRRLILALALSAGLTPAFAQAPPPVPALPDSERRTSYSISASTCVCSVGFALYGDSTDYANWLEIFINGVRVNFNDSTFGWTITSPTGSLATIPRPVTDAVLTFNAVQTGTIQIVGARRPRRVSQFSENRGVPARDLNQALTDIISQNRENWDKINDVTGRGLFSQPGVTLGLLPAPSACANGFIGFDATGLIPLCRVGAGAGNVVGPLTATSGNAAIFGATPNLIADAGAPPVLTTRNINTTAPLAGGGSLAADRTLTLNIGAGLTTSGGNLILANPSASTLGGVQSIVSVAHQWINSISTSGVPSLSQPAFSDISGQWTLVQGPTIGANTVLGSIAGGTPIALSQAQITAMINAATASLPGALPAWPNNTTTFFRGDGTYATLNVAAIGGLGAGVATALGNGTDGAGGIVVITSALTLNGVVYGGGNGGSPGSTVAGINGQFFAGVTSGPPQWATMSQDCTVTNAGVMTCLKTNNVAFTSAATTAIGTSGATIPLNNGSNTLSGTDNFTGTFQINGNTQTFPAAAATLTQTIASGALALATTAIASGACTSAQTASATGTATTDSIIASFNADPTATTGYIPLTMLTIIPYPTLNTANFKVCNNTAGSITPGAVTINWRVVR